MSERSRRYGLEPVFQMFDVFRVDLRRRWLQARSPADVERIWDECKRDAKSAYRAFSRKLHPDVNPDPRAHEEMKHLTQLWRTLDGLKLNLKPRRPQTVTQVFVGVRTVYRPSTSTSAHTDTATSSVAGTEWPF